MAKGSVRKKGKKWYYRFYVNDTNGKKLQKEFVGTESKSETEKMLRKAMADYESNSLLVDSKNITLGVLLDVWIEEDLKPGNLSNGTVIAYQGAAMRIQEHPIANCRIKNITAINLQEYIDFLVFGKKGGSDTVEISRGYLRIFTAVLQRAFKFAVFPKGYINYNPMEYVSIRHRKDNAGLFAESDEYRQSSSIITHQQYQQITEYLERRNNPALLPIQIAYYTGLRIGEVCGLAWQDINIEEQYMTIRRSMRYNITLHRTEIDTTKRNKVRTVHFGNTLTDILKAAMEKQHLYEISYGTSYYYNYYAQTSDNKRIHYEIYSINGYESVPAEYKKISFTCCRNNGLYEAPSTIASICRMLGKKINTLNGFHFHMLRHTYTSNLLMKGASPKDVQELLGHTSVNTTLNIYAHSSQDAKHNSAMLLDNI